LDTFKVDDTGLIKFKGVVYLPKTVRKPLVKELYKEPFKGHLRIEKIKDAVAIRYYFPSILRMVEQVVKECDLC
jgi:hypothetical protein